MKLIFRYLKPYILTVLAIVVLTFVQVQSELLLPDYMSGIVTNGIQYGGIEEETPVALTKKEFDTLKYLMEHKGTAVTRDKLMNEVWGYDYFGDSNIVDVYIRYLRHKIDDQFNIKTIHTIRSVGYLFDYEEEQE